MNFISVEDNDYLVYSDLQDFQEIDSICYVVKVDNSISSIETPYYRLIVRSIDDKLIPCVVFSIEEFHSLGFKLNALKNKYIRLKATAQEFNGRMSLKFKSMSVFTEVTPELVIKFQKKIENLEEYYNDLNNVFKSYANQEFPSILRSKCYPSIHKGYSGGFVKFSWDMLINCQAAVADVKQDDFMNILFSSLVHYSEYLDKELQLNIITDSDRITLVSNIPANDYTGRLIRETVSSLIGLSRPNHLIPVLITNAFNYINSMYVIKDSWSMLRPGGATECEGVRLLKY